MEGIDHVFNGVGYLTYAIAIADGTVQQEEFNALKQFVEKEAKARGFHALFTQMVFNVIMDEKPDKQTALYIGLEELKKHSYYLKESLKAEIMEFLEELAAAFPPVEQEEKEILRVVREQLWNIHSM